MSLCVTLDGLFILLPQTLPPFSLSVRFTQTYFPLQLLILLKVAYSH